MYEPFLVQQGYLIRTARGRIATDLSYKHLNRTKESGGQQEIF